MAGIPAESLAELAPCDLEEVGRLVDLGILRPDEDGLYAPSDVHVVRLMAAFERTGIDLRHVGRGMAEGTFQYPLGLFMPPPGAIVGTYAELADRLGRSPELLRRLSTELGVPPRADDRVRDEDAEIIELLLTTLDVAEDDELSRFARLYGGTLQRLVTAGLQFFDRTFRARAEALELPVEERDRWVYERGGAYTELVQRIVPWLQRRNREHVLLQYLVGLTEGWMEERGIAAPPPRKPPAIAFLDLTGYTALAEDRGDEAAAEVAAALAGIVQRAAAAHGGRPVKWLGDGVMFHFDESAGAVRCGLHLVEEAERRISVPARIGINAGAVIVQEGDYFGRTVNVAARIADYAQPREVLVSEEARASAETTDVEYELVGDVALKGVSRLVRVHRAARAPAGRGSAGA
ncbi:MAG TPA: adenylate/guanylate cyclase domain-containing protein [Gaiellaceae bacterium]|nr:adenylate/guanylate cyclase domain-containing protein [Gaiellaceae bacterium]